MLPNNPKLLEQKLFLLLSLSWILQHCSRL